MKEHSTDHTTDNDFQLLADFRQGNTNALDMIFTKYHQRLYHYARRFVQNGPEAEDITSEAFMKLWSRKDQFDNLPAMLVYLHKIVKNRCLDYLKHQQVKVNHHSDMVQVLEDSHEGDFLVEMIRLELIKKIYDEVEKLPAKTREVFMLSYRDGLKPSQIAELLSVSVQTVKNQRVTAISLLREFFRNNPLILVFLMLLEQDIY